LNAQIVATLPWQMGDPQGGGDQGEQAKDIVIQSGTALLPGWLWSGAQWLPCIGNSCFPFHFQGLLLLLEVMVWCCV
jgi:hypothetical protein